MQQQRPWFCIYLTTVSVTVTFSVILLDLQVMEQALCLAKNLVLAIGYYKSNPGLFFGGFQFTGSSCLLETQSLR